MKIGLREFDFSRWLTDKSPQPAELASESLDVGAEEPLAARPPAQTFSALRWLRILPSPAGDGRRRRIILPNLLPRPSRSGGGIEGGGLRPQNRLHSASSGGRRICQSTSFSRFTSGQV